MSLSFRPANGGLSPPVQRLIAGAYPPPNAKLFLLTMRFQLADIAQRKLALPGVYLMSSGNVRRFFVL
ncbi:hypothetical protein PF005_g23082 [Phytophthora fragariae]|uniref:Uncharacterized protein n=1 Tax=Phytophthora fragariae TaxID=53985 RepID=A0A6A3W9Q1_9STRA|nr:hypothetical protein PF006_g21365 [Phytophthora fragariae]KAE9180922.1 hypothetical protein PF005_g23082 [Phytophthora fragariae]KAE9195411.1 hypothetical protein PF002_g23335 [Phytophthora fragariae]KAE9284419.1 hypothetical protein PF001_g22396 [Phytophthora fragariae]